MDWVKKYQLFLFDFDGLLVDTETLHFDAYHLMCRNRGFVLPWDFEQFASIAHHSSTGLKEKIYEDIPALQPVDWPLLYREKQENYRFLLESRGAGLMPGVEALLTHLQETKKPHVVVTNSTLQQTEQIRRQHKILESIPHWITREDYEEPKPEGDCYQLAMKRYAKPGDQVIGFEDTPRGIKALLTTEAKPVLISNLLFEAPRVSRFPSILSIKDLD